MKPTLISCAFLCFVAIGSTACEQRNRTLPLASPPAADAPQFMKVGKRYDLAYGGMSFRVTVIEIGTQGWIKSNATRLDTQAQPITAWFNTNQTILIGEV